MDEEDEKEFVSLANEFVQKCNLNVRVEKSSDCKDEFFVSLYQGLVGDNLKGLIANPLNQDEHVHNCQCVIDGLSKDVLNVDLSHISAEGIINGDIISIRNLLEIFSGLLEYFMECIDEDPSDLEDDFNDSNAMTAEHDVISSLLKEEFGSSSKDVKMKDSTTMEQQASNHRNKAQSGPPLSSSSYYDRGNHSTITNTRMSTDPASFRTSTFTASGHEADVSEVSDSTNELIKLGESSTHSSSRNSTPRKMTATSKSLSKDNGLQQGPAKTTWKHSMLSNNGTPQDLTQYSMSSDEGDKDSLPDNKNGSDNLSSSLVSSTSSWRQQISPLDADNNGIILDTLGVRPKVDASLAVAAKDSSEDGGSGRSTPVLHHHYHHHFHHPAESDSKVHKTATSTSTHYSTDHFQDYTKYPGNVKSSAVGTIRSAPPTNNVGSHALAQRESILPGQTIGITDYSYTTRAGLPGKTTRSDGIPGVAGQSTRTDIPSVSFLDSTRRGVGLPGQATKTSIASEYSNEDTRFPGQTISSYAKPSVPLSEYSRPSNGLPGQATKTSIAPEYSNKDTRLPGQTISSYAKPSVPLSEYSRPTNGLPGQTTKTSIAPEYSNEDTRFPGQTISSYAKPSVPLSEYSRPSNGLPGQSTISDITSSSFPNYTSPRSGAPLSDYSRLETGKSVTGQSTTSGTTSKAFTDYPTSVSSLAGQSQTRMSSVPLSDYSRLGTGVTGQSTAGGATGRAFTEYSTRDSGLPGPSHTSSGLTSGVSSRLGAGVTGQTTSSGLGQRSLLDRYLPRGTSSTLPSTHVTSIPSSLGVHTVSSIPSSSGLHTVSSGGLTDSVFTGTGTSDMIDLRKKFQPPITKSLDTKQTKEFEEREKSQVDATQDMVSTQRPTQFHDKSVSKVTSLKNQEAQEDMDVDSLGSDDDSDDDGARYSDSAIDYSRGGLPDDSESESEDSILRRIHDRWKTLKTRQSSKAKPVRRAVTFNEDIETIPITGRMDRLRRLLEDEADEQRQHATAIRDAYAEQLQDIQTQQQQERKGMKKRKVQRSPLVPKKKAKKPIPVKQRGRLEAIYRPQGRLGRAPKRLPVKSRKRSASASPDIGRRRKTNTDVHETLLPSLFEEFPFLHVSPQTTHAMWQKQARQISLLSKPESATKKTKGQRNVEEAEKRQERLLKVLRKELEYNQRMRGERERQDHQRAVKVKVNEKRQVAARARRYYDEYQLRMRSKMLKRRTREEQILKRLFDDGLEIQKQRVRELRKYAKEKTETLEQKQTNEIVSLENYYKDQFSMLAEGMTRERHELKVRQQAQEKVMGQMRRELRKKMEKEIQDLQETLTRDEDSAYFRQLEADRLRREFQLAMYKSDL